MAQAATNRSTGLRPSPRALQKALKDSADRAQRMAKAFGLKVPGIATAAPKKLAKKQA
jgi:uncharacterized protein YggE